MTQSQGLKKSAARGGKISDGSKAARQPHETPDFRAVAERYLGNSAAAPVLSQLHRYWERRIAGRAGFTRGQARLTLLQRGLRRVQEFQATLSGLGLVDIAELFTPDVTEGISSPRGKLGLQEADELARSLSLLTGGLERAIGQHVAAPRGRRQSSDLVREAVGDLLQVWWRYRAEPASQSKAGFAGFAEEVLAQPSLEWKKDRVRHAVADALGSTPAGGAPQIQTTRTMEVPLTRHRVLILDAGAGLPLEAARRAQMAGMDVIATTDGLAGGDALKALGVTVVEATLDEPGSILAGIKAEALHAVLWVDPFGKEDIKSGKTIGAALDRFEAVQHALSPLLRKSGRAGSFVVVEAVPDDEAAEDAGGINWAGVGRDFIRSLLRQAASAADRGGVGYGLICIDRDTTQAPERVASARRVARALERTPNQWNGRAYSEDGDPSAL